MNGRRWSKDVMRAALRAAVHTQASIALLAENGDYFKTYQVDYHGGEQYPHLVRAEGQPDVLSDIIAPQTP